MIGDRNMTSYELTCEPRGAVPELLAECPRSCGTFIENTFDIIPAAQGAPPEVADGYLERVFNRGLALLLCPLAILVMGPFYIAWFFTERRNGPFLYQGTRLGKGKIPFKLYKIRSLVNGAEKTIGARLHSSNADHELWYGRFIRNTRIDEMPQLFNILRGDMDFVGPRPDRPIMYETELRFLKGYDKRFTVRPGLTGYSQFYTPHNTPKRLRVQIDNYFIRRNHTLVRKLVFVGRTIGQFLLIVVTELAHTFQGAANQLHKGKSKRDRRNYRRYAMKRERCSVTVYKCNKRVERFSTIHLLDLNHESICVTMPAHLINIDDSIVVAIAVNYTKRRRQRTERITLEGKVAHIRAQSDINSKRVVITIDQISAIDRYKFHKYLLCQVYANTY
jgi:lipopolysaccharide/colanic/teichoic acid biosynthesis glycosyltransferase